MSPRYDQNHPVPWDGAWSDPDYRRRYGTPPEPTIRGRTATMLGHIYTGLGLTMIAAGVLLMTIIIDQLISGNIDLMMTGMLGLIVVFMVAVGYRTWYRSSLDEWALQHDRMKWDELEEEVEDTRMQLESMQASHDQAIRERDEQYARLDAEYRQAVITINSLRVQLAGGAQHKNASFIPKETPTQVAIRAIADAYRAARPYTRQAICADGSISQESWRDAMDLLHRHRLAVQERKGAPWRITAANADVLLAAGGIAPRVGSYVALEEEA